MAIPLIPIALGAALLSGAAVTNNNVDGTGVLEDVWDDTRRFLGNTSHAVVNGVTGAWDWLTRGPGVSTASPIQGKITNQKIRDYYNQRAAPADATRTTTRVYSPNTPVEVVTPQSLSTTQQWIDPLLTATLNGDPLAKALFLKKYFANEAPAAEEESQSLAPAGTSSSSTASGALDPNDNKKNKKKDKKDKNPRIWSLKNMFGYGRPEGQRLGNWLRLTRWGLIYEPLGTLGMDVIYNARKDNPSFYNWDSRFFTKWSLPGAVGGFLWNSADPNVKPGDALRSSNTEPTQPVIANPVNGSTANDTTPAVETNTLQSTKRMSEWRKTRKNLNPEL